MWIYFPGLWRALFKSGREHIQARSGNVDVYVLQHRLENGGKLYFLFTKPLPACVLGPMVSDLSARTYLVGGSIEMNPHTVTVRWSRTREVWEPEYYLVADIRLTVFDYLLGKLEPRHDCRTILSNEAEYYIAKFTREHGIDWATELGLPAR